MAIIKALRIVSFIALFALLIVAFFFDVPLLFRFWPIILLAIIAVSLGCDVLIGLHDGRIAIGPVAVLRATHRRWFATLIAVHGALFIAVLLLGIVMAVRRF